MDYTEKEPKMINTLFGNMTILIIERTIKDMDKQPSLK